MALVLTASLLASAPAAAAPSGTQRGGSAYKSVPVGKVPVRQRASALTDTSATQPDGTTIPGAAEGDVATGTDAVIGALPVAVGAPAPLPADTQQAGSTSGGSASLTDTTGMVHIQVLDQPTATSLGVRGVAMKINRADGVGTWGRVSLRVTYENFANAYGGDFGGRLQLVAFPACAVTTPDQPECLVRQDLGSVNNQSTGTVSADVSVPGDPTVSTDSQPMLLAVTSSSSSGGGTFAATSLSPSYSWSAGNQGGSFSYSYPIKVPPAPGSSPAVALSYSSGSVDAQTLAQNGQTSWAGEGWDLPSSYIERSYRSCKDDGQSTADLCWFSSYNATMVFQGRSMQLVRDDTTGVWHGGDDDGTRVEQLWGTANDRGDNESYSREYWRVTTKDGTQYFFGVGKRYANDPWQTHGTLTEPVYGNNSGEPCYNSVFANAVCWQPYRWNLDYVLDPRGNSMTYYYNKFTGAYGAQNGTQGWNYDYSATLDHIDYGTRAGSEALGAPLRVLFTATDRCVNTCNQNTSDYPDTPWDLYCAPNVSPCANLPSIVHWNPKKLSTISTQRWSSAAQAYTNIDRYDLAYTYPSSGDYILPSGNDTSPNLWLLNITHTGYAPDGSTLSEPAVGFSGIRLANRKDWGDDLGVAPYMHYRISQVDNGTGGVANVTYSDAECTRSTNPQSDVNPYRCFPQYFKPELASAGWGWFQKYVVNQVVDQDLTGGQLDEHWTYAYSNDGTSDTSLWGHDSAETALLAYRSWSDWAGYSTVTTTHGRDGTTQSVKKTLYYRGMDGDGKATADNSGMLWDNRRVGLNDSQPRDVGVTAPLVGLAGKCVDIPNWNTANGTQLDLWECNGGDNQMWTLQADGTYKNPYSGRCMDMSGTANGAAVQLWDCTGASNQQWPVYPDSSMRSPASGRCLDVNASNQANGTLIFAWDCYGGASQHWAYNRRDYRGLRGTPREESTLSGGNVVASTIHVPEVTLTATRSKPNPTGEDVKAYMSNEVRVRTRTWLAASSTWRWTDVKTTYDSYGLPVDITDLADVDVSTDNVCTHLDYARDTSKMLIDYIAQTLVKRCTTPLTDADYLAGTQTLYDNTTTMGVAPTQGLATRTNVMTSVVSGVKNWKQQARTGYDFYGRATTTYDALDRATTTDYTPTEGPPTSVTVTNPLGHATTTNIDTTHGSVTSVVDPNGKVTNAAYDPLGRLLKVWNPGRSTSQTPDAEYAYTLRNTGANAVLTKSLNAAGNQVSSYTLYDGRMRPRQTQSPAPQANGGRMISDTVYDSRGLAVKTSTFWNSASGPSDSLVSFADTDVDSQHRITFDDQDRATADALYSQDVIKWQTTMAYDGDRVTVTPPSGGTATTTIKDAKGQKTTLRQYLGSTPTGSSQDTRYEYDRLGKLTKITDPAGNVWTYGYDLRGNKTSMTDPDHGASTMTYDDAGQMLTSTDARGTTLSTTYDDLGRRTAVYNGTVDPAHLLAEWGYDSIVNNGTTTQVKGQPVWSKRWSNGNAYESRVTGMDEEYRPTGGEVVVPAAEGSLAGTYATTTTYNVNGSVATSSYPAAAGMAAETVTYSYDNTGAPLTMSGQDTYVAGTTYYPWGAINQLTLGAPGKRVRSTTVLDPATQRIASLKTETEDQTTPGTWVDALSTSYSYDPSGNVTSIADNTGGSLVSRECFTYDGLRQLSEAWTTTTACQSTPSQAVVAGPDPYWNSYRYDPVGNRTSDVSHAVAGDTTRTYAYPLAGAARPHAVTSVSSSGPAGSKTDSYGYDQAGNTQTRNISGKPGQTLTWDAEGHLASVVDSTATTTYLYDTAGGRLIGKDINGATLYLGSTEVRQAISGALSATRYYSAGGATVATRTTSDGLVWQTGDHHKTGQLTVNATTMATVTRRSDPFGIPRGTQPYWPTNRGFVDGTNDPTGLTHLGAREYEPGTGRFISVDPIMDSDDPLQMEGYSYSNNSPVTASDPGGTILEEVFFGYDDFPMANSNRCWHGCNDGSYRDHTSQTRPGPSAEHGRNGTAVVAHQNGGTGQAVNGFYISAPGPDPRKLADALDRLRGKQGDFNTYCEYKCSRDTAAAILNVCGRGGALSGQCSEEFIAEVYDYFYQDVCSEVCDLSVDGFRALGYIPKVPSGGGRASSPKSGTDMACNSFSPDTLVLMADGTTRPIGAIQVGDVVLAADPLTGKRAAEKVTRLHVNSDTDLLDLKVAVSGGESVEIHTTQGHPFWDVTISQWTDAGQLRLGDTLLAVDGGSPMVLGLATHSSPELMWNLTVEEVHTYYVVAGGVSILVHNSMCESVSGILPKKGRAPEYSGGIISEDQAMDLAGRWLGDEYTDAGNGRFVSADGTRIVRYGTHETKDPKNHHIHFESAENGRTTENTSVRIAP